MNIYIMIAILKHERRKSNTGLNTGLPVIQRVPSPSVDNQKLRIKGNLISLPHPMYPYLSLYALQSCKRSLALTK